jgi:hypothetical protein
LLPPTHASPQPFGHFVLRRSTAARACADTVASSEHGRPAFTPSTHALPDTSDCVHATEGGDTTVAVVRGLSSTSIVARRLLAGGAQSLLVVPNAAVGPPKGGFGRQGASTFGP